MPLEAINSLLFCKQDIEADDIIDVLVPKYGLLKDDPDYPGTESQKLVLRVIEGSDDDQKTTQEGILVDLLRERGGEFLKDFLWYTTGYMYMPRSNFKIIVEFNYHDIETRSEHSLPVAHTCELLLKLPGQAYDGNQEILEQKLDLCFEQGKSSRFDMK